MSLQQQETPAAFDSKSDSNIEDEDQLHGQSNEEDECEKQNFPLDPLPAHNNP